VHTRKPGPGRHTVEDALKIRHETTLDTSFDPNAEPESPVNVDFGFDPNEKPPYSGKYPFPDMPKPGPGPDGKMRYASFLVAYEEGITSKQICARIDSAVKHYTKNFEPTFKAKCKEMPDGIRVFRME
jgi:hypothetical protein